MLSSVTAYSYAAIISAISALLSSSEYSYSSASPKSPFAICRAISDVMIFGRTRRTGIAAGMESALSSWMLILIRPSSVVNSTFTVRAAPVSPTGAGISADCSGLPQAYSHSAAQQRNSKIYFFISTTFQKQNSVLRCICPGNSGKIYAVR